MAAGARRVEISGVDSFVAMATLCARVHAGLSPPCSGEEAGCEPWRVWPPGTRGQQRPLPRSPLRGFCAPRRPLCTQRLVLPLLGESGSHTPRRGDPADVLWGLATLPGSRSLTAASRRTPSSPGGALMTKT